MSSLSKTLNFNVGVLGHVDSGKTSITKALSTVSSTACFDKNPQSKERGITLDLGFSSFTVDAPEHIKNSSQFEKLQFTLVDCPGHASLIRTIIGGSQIVDMMLLVVDITKGIQTQTAECLIIGEITCKLMLIVLNKVDLISPDKRDATIEKTKKRLWKTLEATKFANCDIVVTAANPGGVEACNTEAIGINSLIEALRANSYRPLRKADGPLLFSVDHCFLIKGQGTVMTGTMLSGSLSVNETVEISSLKVTKKVKSIQMFKTSVNSAIQGDRIGICVTQFDPKLLERGLVSRPGVLSSTNKIITSVHKIQYFKGIVSSKGGKFHITIGHETTMGRCTFFEGSLGDQVPSDEEAGNMKIDPGDLEFDFSKEYIYKENLDCEDKKAVTTTSDGVENSEKAVSKKSFFAVIDLDHSVTCCTNFLVIASKLDTDIHVNTCRLAFHGRIVGSFAQDSSNLSSLKIYKTKRREGVVERKLDENTVICRNLFKKETNIDVFINLKIRLSTGETGFIEGSFGKSGKTKIRISGGLSESTSNRLKHSIKSTSQHVSNNLHEEKDYKQSDNSDGETIKIFLEFKRYIFDTNKKILQI